MTSDDPLPTGPAGPGDPPSDPQDFVFGRELAEVYLLLDNVSSVASKKIPAPEVNDPLFGANTTWLQEVCAIGWPPHEPPGDRALKAAKLIRARDMLNAAASPSTGASIAFTLLVMGEASKGWRMRDGEEPSRLRRTMLWLIGYRQCQCCKGPCERRMEGGQRARLTYHLDWPWQGWGGEPPTRSSLAAMAFPNLVRSAGRFVKLAWALAFTLVCWLTFTCGLSWDVATGNALLGDYQQLNKQVLATRMAILLSQEKDATPGSPPVVHTVATTPDQADGHPNLTADMLTGTGRSPDEYCKQVNASKPEDKLAPLRDISLCADLVEQSGHLHASANNFMRWANGQENGPFLSARFFLNILSNFAGLTPAIGQDVNAQWAAVWLTVMGTIVLPILYGVVGAGAAVVRNLSARVRDSMLSPRDGILMWIRLGLGAIMGGCIGLFVSPTGGSGDLSGMTHLTTSALCFLAGFSVEGVFQALEGLTNHIFNVNSGTPGT